MQSRQWEGRIRGERRSQREMNTMNDERLLFFSRKEGGLLGERVVLSGHVDPPMTWQDTFVRLVFIPFSPRFDLCFCSPDTLTQSDKRKPIQSRDKLNQEMSKEMRWSWERLSCHLIAVTFIECKPFSRYDCISRWVIPYQIVLFLC